MEALVCSSSDYFQPVDLTVIVTLTGSSSPGGGAWLGVGLGVGVALRGEEARGIEMVGPGRNQSSLYSFFTVM